MNVDLRNELAKLVEDIQKRHRDIEEQVLAAARPADPRGNLTHFRETLWRHRRGRSPGQAAWYRLRVVDRLSNERLMPCIAAQRQPCRAYSRRPLAMSSGVRRRRQPDLVVRGGLCLRIVMSRAKRFTRRILSAKRAVGDRWRILKTSFRRRLSTIPPRRWLNSVDKVTRGWSQGTKTWLRRKAPSLRCKQMGTSDSGGLGTPRRNPPRPSWTKLR